MGRPRAADPPPRARPLSLAGRLTPTSKATRGWERREQGPDQYRGDRHHHIRGAAARIPEPHLRPGQAPRDRAAARSGTWPTAIVWPLAVLSGVYVVLVALNLAPKAAH